jgi:hypothetical protein
MENQAAAKIRRVFTPDQRAQMVERYRQSGLTQQEFVKQEGISLASLSNWLNRRPELSRSKRARPRFQEVAVLDRVGGWWALELVSPNRWTVRFNQLPSSTVVEQVLKPLPC